MGQNTLGDHMHIQSIRSRHRACNLKLMPFDNHHTDPLAGYCTGCVRLAAVPQRAHELHRARRRARQPLARADEVQQLLFRAVVQLSASLRRRLREA